MTIFVTGATGFMGGHLVEMLLEEHNLVEHPQDIIALVRKESDTSFLRKFDIKLIFGDLRDPKSLKGAFKDVDIVFHLAAIYNDWAHYNEFVETNVEGTKNILEAAFSGNGNPKFVHTSSAAAYGFGRDDLPIKEGFRGENLFPSFDYAESKRASELVLWEYVGENGAPISVVRPSAVFGPRDRMTFPIFSRFLTDRISIPFLPEIKFPWIGSLDCRISFVYVKDAVNALITVATSKKTDGEAYNVVSFDPTMRKFLSVIATNLGEELPYRTIPATPLKTVGTLWFGLRDFLRIPRKEGAFTKLMIKALGKSMICDTTKIKKLGFTPVYDLEEAVSHTVSSMKEIKQKEREKH